MTVPFPAHAVWLNDAAIPVGPTNTVTQPVDADPAGTLKQDFSPSSIITQLFVSVSHTYFGSPALGIAFVCDMQNGFSVGEMSAMRSVRLRRASIESTRSPSLFVTSQYGHFDAAPGSVQPRYRGPEGGAGGDGPGAGGDGGKGSLHGFVGVASGHEAVNTLIASEPPQNCDELPGHFLSQAWLAAGAVPLAQPLPQKHCSPNSTPTSTSAPWNPSAQHFWAHVARLKVGA